MQIEDNKAQTKFVGLRITAREKEILNEIAVAEYRTVSDVIRMLINEKIESYSYGGENGRKTKQIKRKKFQGAR